MPDSGTGWMVGRDAERAAIDALLKVHSGLLALVVEGETGIGKTTLWWAGLDRAGFEVPADAVARAYRQSLPGEVG
jgi:hypothetical protein